MDRESSHFARSVAANRRYAIGLSWAGMALLAGLVGTDPAHAHDERAVALLHQYRCYVCHANNEPKAGPAYADVATYYKGKAGALSRVAAVIRSGAHGAGPWHMPPHPEVSKADARTMARYILSLRR
ncbi:MAG: cytochrome C' [Betaproteobacteria bacterium]|nr:cytochrome C' [Betaproteobacteria bacterium]